MEFALRTQRGNPKEDGFILGTKQVFTTEAKATTRLNGEILSTGLLLIYKIPDAGFENPYDIQGIVQGGKHVAIELKIIKTIKINYGVILSKCEIHQIINLAMEQRMGGISIIGAYHKHTKSFYFYHYRDGKN